MWTAEGDEADVGFGCSVATAGDVNNDGFSECIVGACFSTSGEANEGRAFLWHGSMTGLGTGPAWTAEGNQQSVSFGHAVAHAGDVNGDGFSDIIVGSPMLDDEGHVFLYYGNSGPGVARVPRQIQPDVNVPISLMGNSSADAFRVQLMPPRPLGRGKSRLIWEFNHQKRSWEADIRAY